MGELFRGHSRRSPKRNSLEQTGAQFQRGQALLEDFLQARAVHKAPRLHEAIQCYREALRTFTEQDYPADWAMAQNNLGIAYAHLPTGDHGANLREAIACYQAALRVYTEQDFPVGWARTHGNLGNAHGELAEDDVEKSQVITCYEAALRVFTPESFPLEWAHTLDSMGRVYSSFSPFCAWKWAEAIPCFLAAMRVLTGQDFPFEWATILNNLAAVYSKLPATDRTRNLKAAIEYHRAALRVLTEKDYPSEWAGTLNKIAAIYAELPRDDREANVRAAIDCHQAVLRVLLQRDFPKEWAETQCKLGDAYRRLRSGDSDSNLKKAIGCYEAALCVYGAKDLSVQLAEAHKKMDGVIKARRSIVDGAPFYGEALRIGREWGFPYQWAETQHKLGEAYARLRTGDQEANLDKAITYFRAAMRVRRGTPSALGPREDYLETLRELTLPLFQKQAWPDALATCREALDLLERERPMRVTKDMQRSVLSENAALFDRAVGCSLELGRFADALTYAERGKARILTETLTRRDVKPRGVPDADWRTYLDLLNELDGWERSKELLSTFGSPYNRLDSELRQYEERFRAADPDYLPTAPPLMFADILEIVRQANAVLVEFRVTDAGTIVFLLSGSDADMTAEQVISVPQFTSEVLNAILIGQERRHGVDGWLVQYDRFRRHELSLESWLACVERTTNKLYRCLMAPVHGRLRDRYPQAERLILVPNRGLSLLPLHAVWWQSPDGEHRYLLDKDGYDVAYVPSCQVLKRCLVRERAIGAPARDLFAVQNPDGTLPFSDWEVEEVSKFFRPEDCKVLAGPKATEEAVKASVTFGVEKLFSCHAVFDPGDLQRSRLELVKGGKLALTDILPLDLRGTWLVAMSACETGLTDYRDIIDEYYGLPAAFLVAGAATVVPSLWEVNDFSTALLMQRFHSNLYQGLMPKASALREAQSWLRGRSLEEVQAILVAKRKNLNAAKLGGQRMAAIDFAKTQFLLQDLAEHYEGKPFANPHWWGAFQCVGAGWAS